jgi:hypothetical protein
LGVVHRFSQNCFLSKSLDSNGDQWGFSGDRILGMLGISSLKSPTVRPLEWLGWGSNDAAEVIAFETVEGGGVAHSAGPFQAMGYWLLALPWVFGVWVMGMEA